MKLMRSMPGCRRPRRAGEQGVHRPPALVDGRLDGSLVGHVDLHGGDPVEGDLGPVHHDDVGAGVAHDLGDRGAHAGRPADHHRPLAVVPERIEQAHRPCPLLCHPVPGGLMPSGWFCNVGSRSTLVQFSPLRFGRSPAPSARRSREVPSVTTTPSLDLDRLTPGSTSGGWARRGRRSRRPSSPVARRTRSTRSAGSDLHAALRIPPPEAPERRDGGILREWRIIEALDGTEVPHTPAVAVCEDADGAGPHLLPDGVRRRLGVTDEPRRLARAPFDDRSRGPGRPRLPVGRGDRPAVEGRLAGSGPGGARAARTASTSARSGGGPRFLDAGQGP